MTRAWLSKRNPIKVMASRIKNVLDHDDTLQARSTSGDHSTRRLVPGYCQTCNDTTSAVGRCILGVSDTECANSAGRMGLP